MRGKNLVEAFGPQHPVVEYVTLHSPAKSAAWLIHELMVNFPAEYKTYLGLHHKVSQEARAETKQLLNGFNFSETLRHVVASCTLSTVKNFVEEFNVDVRLYTNVILEW